eukprot:gene16871-23142_t
MAANSTSICAPSVGYKEHLQVLNGFLAKSDGKDKLTALIQYACLFLSAGEPGNIKKVQASVTAARKVFRVLKMDCLLNQPGCTGKQPVVTEAVNKLKSLLMAMYFGADHIVWAHQIGLATDKTSLERWQKVSLWSWAMGSVATVIVESWMIAEGSVVRREGEREEDFNQRVAVARKEANARMLTLIHGLVQAALAAGLLQVLPFKPRTLGVLGVVASAMNCYFLMPSYPVKAKQA